MRGSVHPVRKNGQPAKSKRTSEPIWRLVFDGDSANGKRRQKATTFIGTKNAAEAELRRLIAEADALQVDESDMTVEQMLGMWLAAIKPKLKRGEWKPITPKTHERYECMCRANIVPLLGRKRLQKLTWREIESAWETLEDAGSGSRGGNDGLAPRTIRNIHGCLSSALHWAYRKGFIDRIETQTVKLKPLKRRKMAVLDDDGEVTLVRGFDNHWIQPIVIVALNTGARVGELLALKWEDIDPDAGTMNISKSISYTKELGAFEKCTKTEDSERQINLSPFTCDTLRKAKLAMQERNLKLGAGFSQDAQVFDDFIVSGKIGKLLTAATVSDHFRRRVRKLDISPIRFHDLRHIHASKLLSRKEALTAVSERLGHASPNVTLSVYSHAIAGADADMMSRYDDTHLRTL